MRQTDLLRHPFPLSPTACYIIFLAPPTHDRLVVHHGQLIRSSVHTFKRLLSIVDRQQLQEKSCASTRRLDQTEERCIATMMRLRQKERRRRFSKVRKRVKEPGRLVGTKDRNYHFWSSRSRLKQSLMTSFIGSFERRV